MKLLEVKTIPNKDYTLALDLDGVFADFDEGIRTLKSNGVMPEHLDPDEHRDKFWGIMADKVNNFFIGLDKKKDCDQLWKEVKRYEHFFLTARPRKVGNMTNVETEKRQWIRNNLSKQSPVVVCLRSQKKEYASPTTILIDDRKRNIEEWKAAGGIGIYHKNAASTIRQLKDIIKGNR